MAKILSGDVTLVFSLNSSGILESIINYEATTVDNNLKGSLELKLTAAQETQIKNFITGVVIPTIKTWEGIV